MGVASNLSNYSMKNLLLLQLVPKIDEIVNCSLNVLGHKFQGIHPTKSA